MVEVKSHGIFALLFLLWMLILLFILSDRVDLGTSDPVCLDVLINALTNVSSE